MLGNNNPDTTWILSQLIAIDDHLGMVSYHPCYTSISTLVDSLSQHKVMSIFAIEGIFSYLSSRILDALNHPFLGLPHFSQDGFFLSIYRFIPEKKIMIIRFIWRLNILLNQKHKTTQKELMHYCCINFDITSVPLFFLICFLLNGF